MKFTTAILALVVSASSFAATIPSNLALVDASKVTKVINLKNNGKVQTNVVVVQDGLNVENINNQSLFLTMLHTGEDFSKGLSFRLGSALKLISAKVHNEAIIVKYKAAVLGEEAHVETAVISARTAELKLSNVTKNSKDFSATINVETER